MMTRARFAQLVVRLRIVALPLGLGLGLVDPAFGKAPRERSELVAPLGQALCAAPTTSASATQAAWAAGIYDAQIEGRRLEPLVGQAIRAEDAQRKARTLANTRRFGGYAGGVCADGSAWAAAFPAAKGLVGPDAAGRLTLPQALIEECSSYRVDFAASDGGAPRALSVANQQVQTAKLPAGTLSVTCQPKTPRWQGPVLWFLRPVGDGPTVVPPEVDALALANDPRVALATWINRVRIKEGLNPLELSASLAEHAGVLAVDGDLSHNRDLLKKVAAQLDSGNVRFLGEDRVRAADVQQMAWLLWTSPRHRELLLNRDASVGGIALRSLGSEQLAVIALGSKASLSTAKAAGKAPTKRER